MQLQDSLFISPFRRNFFFTSISLLLLLTITYANSFDGSWHFDDYPNIVANPNLHISDLSLKSIRQGIYGKNGSTLFRPLAMLSFALNYYFGEYDVWGYHLVNFSIHYLNTIGLFLLIYFTLTLPRQREKYGKTAYPVALIATIFWATNPMQVSAVTFIVQRMTSLAALGYIYSMLFYMFARNTSTNKKYILYITSLLMALFAFASKENSFMLPISIVLFDLFLITGINKERTIRMGIVLTVVGIAILAASTIYTNPLSILEGYAGRPFSISERLLTEPRVILFYLSLLFYPTAGRLTLLHDIELSTSLFTPVSTVMAILVIIIILAGSIFFAKKRPLISFCCLFFFINHLIEGSIIPLELIYEHRNYLPSILIFVPLALLIVNAINYFSYNRIIQNCFASGLVIILVSQSNTTTMRNSVFRSEISLWQDCVKKAPQLQRALINLGTAYAKDGQTSKAIVYHKKARAATHIPNKLSSKRNQLINANLGGNYYILDNLIQAKRYYQMDIDHDGNGPPKSLEGMTLIFLQENRLVDAEKSISKALSGQPSNPELLVIYSDILLRKGELQEAMKKAELALEIDKMQHKALLIIGLSLRSQGRNRRALDYFTKFLRQKPLDIIGHLAMIEVSQELAKTALVKRYVAELLGLINQDDLNKSITIFNSDYTSAAYNPKKNIQSAFSLAVKEIICN